MKLKIRKSGGKTTIELSTNSGKKPLVIVLDDAQLASAIALLQTAAKLDGLALELEL